MLVNIRIKGMKLRKDPGANACAPEFDLKKLTFLEGSVQFPLSNPANVLVEEKLEKMTSRNEIFRITYGCEMA